MVYSYLVIYVMVEAVVYEEIFVQGKKQRDIEKEMAYSDTDTENDNKEEGNTEIVHASSVYVKMNEMNLDHSRDTYHCYLKHRLSSSESSENSYISKIYPPPYSDVLLTPQEFEITAKMSYTPPTQRRSQLISIENTDTGTDNEIPVFQPPNNRRPNKYSGNQQKQEPNTTTHHETVYTKVVAAIPAETTPAESPVKYTNGARETRESDNPILRQEFFQDREVVGPLKRTTSLDDIHVCNKTRNHYEFINTQDKKNGRARSCEERKRIRSLHYENSTKNNSERIELSSSCPRPRCCSRKRRSCCMHSDSNNNINIKGRKYEKEIVEICKGRKGIRYENEFFTPPNSGITFTVMNDSIHNTYENINDNYIEDEQHYEIVSDQESTTTRERSMTRPIDIKLLTKQHYELHYSDIDHQKTSSKPFSCSSSSLSNRGSMSSSISSDISNSISPPPRPSYRPPFNRFSSHLSCSSGLNSFPASYLDETTLLRITPTTIDTAVRKIASDTNFLDMRPVLVDISQENIRFESNSWDILKNISTHNIVRYEVMSMNALYVAIIAGKPGEETSCYVLQSDKANEIHDSIRTVLHNYTQIAPSRTRSSYELSPTIEPESHRFHYIVKIGSIKVKKAFSQVSHCMEKLLERVNPKEFKSCDMEVSRHSVVVMCTDLKIETHSTPSILSIDLDEKDRRYFGFIISEKAPNNKTKIVCYVYRAAREKTAEQIIEAIKNSCKQAVSSQCYPNTSINPIYAGCRSASMGPLSSINRPTSRLGKMPSCSSVSSLSISSSTPCASDSSPSSGNSRKSSLTDIGWKFDNTSLNSVDPSDSTSNNLNRTSSVKSHTLLETVHFVETKTITNEGPSSGGVTIKAIDNWKLLTKSKLFGKIKRKANKQSTSDSRRSSTTPVPSPNVSPVSLVSEMRLHETTNHNVFYICSSVITPPLKEKRVKEIYRQYKKEVERNGKPEAIGKSIDLKIVTKEGVFLIDRNKPNSIERQYTMSSIDKFMKHPDETGFFAFSVKIQDNTKHNCHLFRVKNSVSLPSIDTAFEKLMTMKGLIDSCI